MGFKCGIVGLPNVGKSTIFNSLTKAGINAENYPFCTIEPNLGIVTVPDHRLDKITSIVKPAQTIATTMEFVDIAGIVSGASRGEGLGNQFLANIRETDAIAHVVRCFHNDNIIHIGGHVDPFDDIATINTELLLADIETIDKALLKIKKHVKSGDKNIQHQHQFYQKVKAHLEAEKPARTLEITQEQKPWLKQLHLLTSKPVLYIANVNEDGMINNPLLKKLERHAQQESASLVAVCAAIEAEISELTDAEEKAMFLNDLGLEEPGLNRIIRSGYDLLNLQTFFTAGPKEVRAWTVTQGACASEAAGVIHSDFQRGFIKAEVTSYNDFIKYGGEHGAKEAGKCRLEGKNYTVQDGDVIHFRFNV